MLDTLASALRRWGPDLRMYYLGNRRSPLHTSPIWTDSAVNTESASALATSLLPKASPASPAGLPDNLIT